MVVEEQLTTLERGYIYVAMLHPYGPDTDFCGHLYVPLILNNIIQYPASVPSTGATLISLFQLFPTFTCPHFVISHFKYFHPFFFPQKLYVFTLFLSSSVS